VVEYDVNTGSFSLYLLLINLEGKSISFSGTGSYLVSTTLLTEEISTYTIGAGADIIVNIETEHETLWDDSIDDIMQDESLLEDVWDDGSGTWIENDYRVETAGGTVTMTLHGLTELVVRSSFFKVTMH
jgi:hypothetical protein